MSATVEQYEDAVNQQMPIYKHLQQLSEEKTAEYDSSKKQLIGNLILIGICECVYGGRGCLV